MVAHYDVFSFFVVLDEDDVEPSGGNPVSRLFRGVDEGESEGDEVLFQGGGVVPVASSFVFYRDMETSALWHEYGVVVADAFLGLFGIGRAAVFAKNCGDILGSDLVGAFGDDVGVAVVGREDESEIFEVLSFGERFGEHGDEGIDYGAQVAGL